MLPFILAAVGGYLVGDSFGKEIDSKIPKFAEGGDVGEVLKVTDGENIWYLTYLDSTHFFLSNTPDFKGSPYHIGQFRSYPYYKQVDEWLKGETRKRMKFADGGIFEENNPKQLKEFIYKLNLLIDEYHANIYLIDGVFEGVDLIEQSVNDELAKQGK